MTTRSTSTRYYADKHDLLSRIFGAEVVVALDAILVGDARYPVLDDVIITLPVGRSPIGVDGGSPASAAAFSPEVQSSFGDQWQTFAEVTPEHRQEFAQYFDLVDLTGLGDAVVADLGCGSGRYAACVAPHSGSLVLADFSEAIFVARENLRDAPHAVFVMADLLDPPFADSAFDFAYSLGVLHHLPVPAFDALRGLQRLAPRFLVYLYYALDNRPWHFRAALVVADGVRRRVSRLRLPATRSIVVWAITLGAYWPLSRLGSLLRPWGLDRLVPLAEFYQGKPLRRLRQDAHDRFLTTIEQRVTRAEILALGNSAWGVNVSDGLPYWHFLYEQRSRVASDLDRSGRTVLSSCPVCGGHPTPGGRPIAFADIWAAFEAEFKAPLPEAMQVRYSPADAVVLAPCADCGLNFFSPAVPAGPEFYEHLDEAGYYDTTWEGAAVAASLRDGDDLVDFGCGDGVALLQGLPERVGRSVGVDHNPTAVRALRDAGLEGYDETFEAFASRQPEAFDVVCAMQVLEHMADVSSLLEACVTVLRPGGRLFIAVPNADRPVARFEPRDFPPHHVSRWRERDLRALALRYGLDVVRISREPGDDNVRRLGVRRAIENKIEMGSFGRVAARTIAHFTPTAMLPRAVVRLAPHAEICGHSLLAEFKKPYTSHPDSAGM